MEWKCTDIGNNIEDIVTKNTGMSKELLLKDNNVYEYNFLDEAVEKFMAHLKSGSKIGVFADYDTDGVTSAAQLEVLCRNIGVQNFNVYVPRRFSDGYGIKERHVELFSDCGLLITVDNGIAAKEVIDEANKVGLDTIILDHHQPRIENGKQVIPDTLIVDPHITGGDFEDLCGAGIVFRFSEKVLNKVGWISEDEKTKLFQKLSCFAALGTVGDVVPLLYDNRVIVRNGLKNMCKGNATSGFKTLMEEANISKPTAMDLGFGLSPIVNASGRMHDNGPQFITKLLAYDGDEKELLTKKIKAAIETNEERKKITNLALERANEKLKDQSDNFIIMIDKDITTGIAGLVSGGITEKTQKPSIVLVPTADPDILKGSGRSVEGVDIKSILDANQDLLLAYGGHPQACGVTVERKNIKALQKAFNELAPKVTEKDLILKYDFVMNIKDSEKTLKEILRFAPYGEGCPEPIVRVNNIKPKLNRTMGSDLQHIKFITEDGVDVIWFNGAQEYKSLGSPEEFDIIGSLGYNIFNGNVTIQILVKDLKKTS